MREATLTRKTTETSITLQLTLEGTGNADIQTGCGFLDHMLVLFIKHSGFDLTLRCTGDTMVDDHHTVEDIGIVLGQALHKALGDCRGITRYGSMLLPMDEALVLVSLDISGRAHLGYALAIPTQKVGSFDTELVEEFLLALCRGLSLTLHVRQLSGSNAHHIIEAAFKGLGRAMRQAVALDAQNAESIPSSKGILL